MYKFIYISILALIIFSPAGAQEKKYIYIDTSLIKTEDPGFIPEPGNEVVVETPVEDHTVTDNIVPDRKPDTLLYLNNLHLSPDSAGQWKNAKDFAYTKYLDSLLRDLKDKEKLDKKNIPETAGPSLMDRFFSSRFIKVLLWTIAGIFVLFILYRLFLTEGAFRREAKALKPDAEEAEAEMISSESDFDALISNALQNDNFRQAVRYHYLRTLHKLADKGLIELAPDKTNYQYVRELKQADRQNEFAALTLNYEYVWYGEFEIGKDIYRKIETGFKNLNQKL